jgi:hypothetical protein
MIMNDLQNDLVAYALGGGSSADIEFYDLMKKHSINILDACIELQRLEHEIGRLLIGFPDEMGD